MNTCVKLGCSLPLTSFEGLHARSQLLAIRLAIEEVQKERELPYTLELVEGDDQFDEDVALELAQNMVNDPRVLGVVGPMNTDTNVKAAPVYAEAGLVHIATAASNPTFTEKGWPTFFRVTVNDTHHYRQAARFAVERLGAKQLAVVHDQSNFTEPMGRGFRDAALELGAQVPAYVAVDRLSGDYDAAIQTLKDHPVDLIFFCCMEPTAAVLAPKVREAGIMTPFFATDGIKPFPYFATPGYDVEGPYYTNVCADPRVHKPAGDMVARYVQRFGEEPTVYVAEAYDAARILIDAFGDGTRTRQEVLECVAKTRDFPGVSATITFDAKGDMLEPAIGIYKVIDGERLEFLGFTKDLLDG